MVEDQFFLASELTRRLQNEGAEVVGPFATVADAQAGLAAHPVDLALIDVELRNGELAFEIARDLKRNRVPLIFVTGLEKSAFPDEFKEELIISKPLAGQIVLREILKAL